MPENFTRARRVGDQIRRDLAELISREVADPRVRGALVSDVEVSRDLAHANVYIICPADNDSAACLEGLGRANGFLRRRLAKSVRMRQVPHLHFHLDTTLDRAAHLDALIAEALPKSESMAKMDADSGDAPVNDRPKL